MPRLPLRLCLVALVLLFAFHAGAQTNNGPFANVSIRHAQALLLWSQSVTSGSSTRYSSLKMYDFIYGKTLADTSLHPMLQPKQTQKLSQTYGPSANRHVALAAGDFAGTGHQRFVAAWQNSSGKINVLVPNINETTLQYDVATVPSALDNLGLLAGTSEYLRTVQLAAGNFTGTDHDQFVLAYPASADSKIHLRTYDTGGKGSLTPVNTADIGDEGISASASYVQQFAIATGDFNKDTKSEIVLAGVDGTAYSNHGGIFVKIYQPNAAGNALTAKARVLVRSLPSTIYQVNLAVATGDFDGDGASDIALTYTFFTQDNNQNTVDSTYLVLLKPSLALDNISVAAKNFVALTPTSSGAHTAAIAAGKIYSDTSAVVVGTSDGYDIYYSTNGSMTPLHIARLSNNTVSPKGPLAYAGNAAIAIGYLQTTYNNARPSIVVAEDLRNSGNDLGTFRLTTFTSDPTDPKNRKWDVNTSVSFSSDSASWGGDNDTRGFALALGDFDKRVQYLGTPRHTQPMVVHPTFIVNAPPTHYDILKGTIFDLNNTYPVSGSGSDFVSSYDTQNQKDSVGGTSIKSGFDVSAELKASKDFGVVSIEASVNTTYAQSTSTDVTKTYSQTYKSGTKASTEDWLYAMQTGYNVWEYPVFKGDTLRGYVVAAIPIAPLAVYESLKGADFDYAARHEVGNLLSYVDHTTLLAGPAIKSLFFTGAVGQQITTSSLGSTGSLNWSSIAEASKTDSSGLSVGASAGGGGFGIELKASGNYSTDQIRTVTTTVSSSTTMGYSYGNVNRQDAYYTVYPLWYWGKNGALVLDYAVDLDLSQQGNFWVTNYGGSADPGLIMPHKFDVQKGDTTAFAAQVKNKTPSIWYYPSSAAVGDTVSLFARINNLSLVDIPQGKIHVSFYNGDPASGGTLLKGVAGDTSVSTVFIPARGQDVARMSWRVAKLPNGRIYAKISFDLTELRTDNNVGWNYFSVLDLGVTSSPESQRPTAFALSQNYPNPFNPTTTIAVHVADRGHVTVKVFDVLGREVATLMDEVKSSGEYSVRFDGSGLASGMYFYRMQAGGFSQVKKMLLVK